MSEPAAIRVFDTTLRDGEQSPGCTMSRDEKLALARQLARLQVDIIEAGFPAAARGDSWRYRPNDTSCTRLG